MTQFKGLVRTCVKLERRLKHWKKSYQKMTQETIKIYSKRSKKTYIASKTNVYQTDGFEKN